MHTTCLLIWFNLLVFKNNFYWFFWNTFKTNHKNWKGVYTFFVQAWQCVFLKSFSLKNVPLLKDSKNKVLILKSFKKKKKNEVKKGLNDTHVVLFYIWFIFPVSIHIDDTLINEKKEKISWWIIIHLWLKAKI